MPTARYPLGVLPNLRRESECATTSADTSVSDTLVSDTLVSDTLVSDTLVTSPQAESGPT